MDGVPFPHLTDPYEAAAALKQHQARASREATAHSNFAPTSARWHLGAAPTQALQGTLMDGLIDVICSDWMNIAARAQP